MIILVRFLRIVCTLLPGLIPLTLIGCGHEPGPSVKRGQPLITEQQAIQRAVQIASMPQPEISGAQVEPTIVKAELRSLADTQQLLNHRLASTQFDLEAPVWVVTMEGRWNNEFPQQAGGAELSPYTHYLVVLHAETGEELQTASW